MDHPDTGGSEDDASGRRGVTNADDVCLLLGSGGAVTDLFTADEIEPLRRSKYGDSRRFNAVNRSGCYMLHNPHTDLVKIGHSLYMRNRWCGLETQGGAYLRPLAFWSTKNASQVETSLHHKFAEYRRIGEWFDVSPVRSWLDEKRKSYTPRPVEVAPQTDECAKAEVKFLKPSDVAARLQISTSKLSRWRNTNQGPVSVKLVGSIRYPAAQFETWLAARGEKVGA